MKLNDLISEIRHDKLSTVEREERLKTFIGTELEFTTDIINIYDNTIYFHHNDSNADSYYETDHLKCSLSYEKERFGKQILAYGIGDKVKITSKITSVTYLNSSNALDCKIDLADIVKLSSREEIEKDRKSVV